MNFPRHDDRVQGLHNEAGILLVGEQELAQPCPDHRERHACDPDCLEQRVGNGAVRVDRVLAAEVRLPPHRDAQHVTRPQQ